MSQPVDDKPSNLYVVLSFLTVALVWGGTNPLLKRGECIVDFSTPYRLHGRIGPAAFSLQFFHLKAARLQIQKSPELD